MRAVGYIGAYPTVVCFVLFEGYAHTQYMAQAGQTTPPRRICTHLLDVVYLNILNIDIRAYILVSMVTIVNVSMYQLTNNL